MHDQTNNIIRAHRAVTSGYAGYAARTGPPCLDATEGPPATSHTYIIEK